MDIHDLSDLSSRDIDYIVKGLSLLLEKEYELHKIFLTYRKEVPTVFLEETQEIEKLIVFLTD